MAVNLNKFHVSGSSDHSKRMVEGLCRKNLVRLLNASTDSFVLDLKQINDYFEDCHTFNHVDNEMRHQMRDIFARRFQESPEIQQQILRFLRILARDKNNLEELLLPNLIQSILDASLLTKKRSFEWNWETLIEAEMCLINLLFNSDMVRKAFIETSAGLLLSRIVQLSHAASRSPGDLDLGSVTISNETVNSSHLLLPIETLNEEQRDFIAFYDLRIAFVASAHSKILQSQWRKNGFEVFLKGLECSLESSEFLKKDTNYSKVVTERTNWLLKILFNIFCYGQEDVPEWSAKRCVSLCAAIVTLKDVEPSLEQSSVDVIAVVLRFPELLVPKLNPEKGQEIRVHYGERDMTFVDAVLRALERRLETENIEDIELLGTFLTVLIHLCQVKEARRYLRLRIIPPLHATDVKRRPDEGAKLRNRMIRLMTGLSNTRNLASEFIFILCKSSVNRFVKYCGFGHAAGLLVNHGMLGALNVPRHSSDSEDSETEDYKAIESQVNPVSGCIEPPREDPFAKMTEEQKEYEVHRLMMDISKLMDHGIVSPGYIGEDGGLRPVKHVLELIKNNVDGKVNENSSDDDQ